MLFTCTECFKLSEGRLDKKTNEVVCQKCSKPIQNITDYSKRMLADNGQVIRENRIEGGYFCDNCEKSTDIALNDDNETVCVNCEKFMDVTRFVKHLLELENKTLKKIKSGK